MESHISKNDKQVLQMILDPSMPFDDDDNKVMNETQDPDLKFDKKKLGQVKDLEKEGVKLAEAKQYNDALKRFDQAISLLPDRASAYNNRAQTKRLTGDVDGAIEDLNKAVSLSSEDKKVAGLAYTQRALILKLRGQNDEAIKDLNKAAELGNKFAKRELIQSNPYAALCNQMLSKVIGDLQRGAATGASQQDNPNKKAKH